MTQLLQLIFIIAGASILGVKFDMDIGWSVGLLCVALMNWPEKKKKSCKHKQAIKATHGGLYCPNCEKTLFPESKIWKNLS